MNIAPYIRKLKTVKAIAEESKDEIKKVGCTIYNSDGILISSGYNGPPRYFKDSAIKMDKSNIEYQSTLINKRDFMLHAEENALIQADIHKIKNGTAYVSTMPCHKCLLKLIQSGVTSIVAEADFVNSNYRNAEIVDYILENIKSNHSLSIIIIDSKKYECAWMFFNSDPYKSGKQYSTFLYSDYPI